MLSTINLPLMEAARHHIRSYDKQAGCRFESYAKSAFVKRYGVSMYLPREQAGLSDKRILRALVRKYPDLNTNIRVITRTTFTEDHPARPPSRRSRIGDVILLLNGDEFYLRLRKYSEEFKFYLSQGFSVTLRGGIRGSDPTPNLSTQFASSVILNSAAEAMRFAMSNP